MFVQQTLRISTDCQILLRTRCPIFQIYLKKLKYTYLLFYGTHELFNRVIGWIVLKSMVIPCRRHYDRIDTMNDCLTTVTSTLPKLTACTMAHVIITHCRRNTYQHTGHSETLLIGSTIVTTAVWIYSVFFQFSQFANDIVIRLLLVSIAFSLWKDMKSKLEPKQ